MKLLNLKKQTIFIALTFFICTNIYSQTNYYISSSTGNDSNNGTSKNNAWKTTTPFNNKVFNEGDIINFQKGGIWAEGSYLELDKGITIKSYGTANEKPIISTLATIDICWTIHSQSNGITIWKGTVNNFISRLFVNEKEYLKSTLFNDLGTNSIGLNELETQQKWFMDKQYNILYLVSDIDPSTLEIKSSSNYFTIRGNQADNVTIQDIEIRGGYGPSIWIRNSKNLVIKNCNIGKYARTGILIGDDSEYVIIKDNIIDSDWDGSLVYGENGGINNSEKKLNSDRGVSNGIQFYDGVINSYIIKNQIKDWGHSGIEFLGDEVGKNGVNNNGILSNTITGENLSYGRAIGIDGILNKCRGNVFKYNFIKDCKAPIQFNGNNNIFHHNIVENTKNSPCKPNEFSGKGIELSIYGFDFVCQSIRIDNNVFIENDSYGVAITNYYNGIDNSLGVEHKVSNIYIRNNIILNNNIANNLINEGIYVESLTSSLVDIRIQNNLIYDTINVNDTVLVDYRGTLTNIETGAPIGNDIYENNIHENPNFSNLNNYNLSNSSPCINAGVNVEYEPYATDFDGDIFPINKPDIGTQENQETFFNKIHQNPKEKNNLEFKSELNNNLNESIKLYPNPLNNILNIDSRNEIEYIKLYHINGKLISLNQITKNSFDMSAISAGIYILNIKTSKSSYFKKMIKN